MFRSILVNIKRRGWADIVRPFKWKIFIRYLAMKAFKKEYEELRIDEYTEQIVVRMQNPGCKACIEAGECVVCGCPSPELFYDRENECADYHWLRMMKPEAWRKHKELNNIKINPKLVKQIRKYGRIK